MVIHFGLVLFFLTVWCVKCQCSHVCVSTRCDLHEWWVCVFVFINLFHLSFLSAQNIYDQSNNSDRVVYCDCNLEWMKKQTEMKSNDVDIEICRSDWQLHAKRKKTDCDSCASTCLSCMVTNTDMNKNKNNNTVKSIGAKMHVSCHIVLLRINSYLFTLA